MVLLMVVVMMVVLLMVVVVLRMGLPGCLWFCHLSEKNKLAWAALLNAMGFATDFFQVTEKWVTCPCDLQTPPLFQGKAIPRASRQDKEQCTQNTRLGQPLHPTLPYPLISYTHLLSIGPKYTG